MIQNISSSSTILSRVDLNQDLFNDLIESKGRNVDYEIAMVCPCSSKEVGSLSSCRNCGGSGWFFINKKRIKAIGQHVGVINEYKNWTEEARGTISLTVPYSVGLSFMDRITIVDSESIYSENVYISSLDDDIFSFLSYSVKKIICVGLYKGVSNPIEWLDSSNYEIDGQIIKATPNSKIVDGSTLTIRYVHAPTYHVVEIQRESSESFKKEGVQDLIQRMPVSAIAKRAHYMLDQKSFNGQLINNSFNDSFHCL